MRHDEETSTFGPISLTVATPEPDLLGILFAAVLFVRRRNEPARKRAAGFTLK